MARAAAPSRRGSGSHASLAQELERLAGMDGPSLRRRWRMLVGRLPPEQLSQAILLRALA